MNNPVKLACFAEEKVFGAFAIQTTELFFHSWSAVSCGKLTLQEPLLVLMKQDKAFTARQCSSLYSYCTLILLDTWSWRENSNKGVWLAVYTVEYKKTN